VVYQSLIEHIVRRLAENPESPDATKDRQRLSDIIEKDFHRRRLFNCWKGGVSDMRVITELPASSLVTESHEEYERIVYGAAQGVLKKNGFSCIDGQWVYQQKL